jgi:hypothetical protein
MVLSRSGISTYTTREVRSLAKQLIACGGLRAPESVAFTAALISGLDLVTGGYQ